MRINSIFEERRPEEEERAETLFLPFPSVRGERTAVRPASGSRKWEETDLDAHKAFAILDVETGADENALRSAYRRKLRLVNPEDDPEGFKTLREAYETALDSLRKEQEEQPEDDSVSGLFVGRIAALYGSLSGRQDEAAWREVFLDPAYLDLEEEENCRKKLIGFLSEHYYLPTQIWRLLGEKLDLTGDKQRLYEDFPKDFIDFLARKAKQGEDFEFEQLEGPDDADLDGWFFLFSKAGREENEKNYDAMTQTLEQAEQKGIRHPGLTMMKARLLRQRGETEASAALLEELLAGPYAQSLNVRYQAAEYLWESGRKDEAAALYEAIRAENRRHYMSNKRLSRWYLEQERYEEAKQCANVLLAYPLDEEGTGTVEQINAGLEHCLTKRLAGHPEDLKARMDLGWCYLQSGRAGETLTLMEGITPAADQEKDFFNLMGKTCYYAKRYEEARPYLLRWAELLRLQLPEEEQAREEDLERIAAAHAMLSAMEAERAETLSGAERDAAFESALDEMDAAKKVHYSPGQDYTRAQIFFQWEKYEACARICEALESGYPEFFAAIALHQQAGARLHDAGAVIGDYYRMRRLDPAFAPAWELAAEVLYQIKQDGDLDRLLREAAENGASSAKLEKYRFFRRADTAEKKSELLAVLEDAARIEERWDEEGWTDSEKAELLAERARNYWRLEDYGQAMAHIDRALALSGGNKMQLYIKAGICKEQKQYGQALSLYLKCRADYDETPHFYANVGECYYRMGQGAEALPYLREAVARREDNAAACDWIVRILKEKMEQDNTLEPLEEALGYAEQMIRHRPEAYFYIERGLLYVLAKDYEKAGKDFEKAVEADPADPYAHSNLARVYLAVGRTEDALDQSLQALENMENAPGSFHYEVLIRIYCRMRRCESALQTGLENWKRFRAESGLDTICSLYCRLGRWQEALDFIDRSFLEDRGGRNGKPGQMGRKAKRARAERFVEVYTKMGFYEQALTYIRAHYKNDGYNDDEIGETVAKVYWYQGRLKRAAAGMRRLLAAYPRESDHFPKLCCQAANIFFFLGKKRDAAVWARAGMDWYREHGGLETWVESLDAHLIRLYALGTMKLYAGEVQEPLSIVEKMRRSPKCLFCMHSFCTDAEELRADVHAAQKEYGAAAALYEKILAEDRTNRDVRVKLALVRKQERKQRRRSGFYDNRH